MYTLPSNEFTSGCQCHTAEMAVVETLWQMHTLIVMNFWYKVSLTVLSVTRWETSLI